MMFQVRYLEVFLNGIFKYFTAGNTLWIFFHEIGIFKNNFNQLQYKKNIFLQEMSGIKNLRTGLSWSWKNSVFQRLLIPGMISKIARMLHEGSFNILALSEITQKPFENRNFWNFDPTLSVNS